LAENGSSKIEKVVKILFDVENELGDIKANIEQKKKEMREFAIKSSEKARNQVLEEATATNKKELDKIISTTEAEAVSILTKSEKNVDDLKKKIDVKFQEALNHVINRVLGEKTET
jgi:vacuolar-type H+-ATPase subunit H